MKIIILSANEDMIKKARKVVAKKHSTLNVMFRQWLEDINNNQDKEDILGKALWIMGAYRLF